jgi:hypothetical protein
MDLEALVVAVPTAGGLVDAPLEGERVFPLVVEDADLRVEDAPASLARDGDLDGELSFAEETRE